MTDPQQGVLNPIGVNCLRTFPGIGTVVFGARTLVVGQPAVRAVEVRRRSGGWRCSSSSRCTRSLGWAVFEPNDTPLWNALTQEVEAFMLGLFRQGASRGARRARRSR